MPHSRFFLKEDFSKNKDLIIQDEELHHLDVMRKKDHSIIEVVNGKNQLAKAEIICLSQKQVTLKIIEVSSSPPPLPKIIIAHPFLRTQKLDLIFEKCTELGAAEFILFKAAHSEISDLSVNKKNRIESILVAAIKQCGRLDLPKVTFMDSLLELKKMDYFFLLGDADSSFAINIGEFKKITKPICFLTGPEKGFTEKEINFCKSELKALLVTVNINILRSETVPIAAMALLSQIYSRKL